MRALLVVNPKATTTSERAQDVLVRALRSEFDLTVERTRRRGHAAALAREAAATGVDVLFTLGGDGTINETVNGLMAGAPAAETRPALAVVPGGSTNVFARALGLPKGWAEGASVILEALRAGRSRTISLGRADDRYFTFCAGLGLDASVVRRVEQARLRGRTSTPALYMRAVVGQFFTAMDRRHPTIRLERPGEQTASELSTVIIQNTAPWTFIGDRAINPNPGASFELGLDVLALRRLRVHSTTRTVTQLLSRNRESHGSQVVRLHDVSEFSLLTEHPQAFQLDGDYLGEREKVRFTSVPGALRVIC
ncbi:diacylglycerol/lipid kinase family protein [Phytohabitans kaempferiae]|uniref:Diacylglycerol/lipid kinase family protein n=1 Tax=Phytohabitans kaempferiae TaxID=1620943 RepID=A0ABV6M3I6_9ACTN